jgi:hypothetical protein
VSVAKRITADHGEPGAPPPSAQIAGDRARPRLRIELEAIG